MQSSSGNKRTIVLIKFCVYLLALTRFNYNIIEVRLKKTLPQSIMNNIFHVDCARIEYK